MSSWQWFIQFSVCVLGTVFLSLVVILVLTLPDDYSNLDTSKYTDSWIYPHVNNALENEYAEIRRQKQQKRDEFFAEHKPTNGHGSLMKPVAKLVGKPLTTEYSDGLTPIESWSTNGDGGFLRQGVRYYKGRLVVPVSGSYCVYSYVGFYEPCFLGNGTPNVEDISLPIKHAIYNYSITDGRNKEIVASEQSHKIARNKYENVYGSYISTVVELNSGDELSVQVSNITLLKYTGDNCFGLILI